jgi:hypothetical protein
MNPTLKFIGVSTDDGEVMDGEEMECCYTLDKEADLRPQDRALIKYIISSTLSLCSRGPLHKVNMHNIYTEISICNL